MQILKFCLHLLAFGKAFITNVIGKAKPFYSTVLPTPVVVTSSVDVKHSPPPPGHTFQIHFWNVYYQALYINMKNNMEKTTSNLEVHQEKFKRQPINPHVVSRLSFLSEVHHLSTF